MIYFALDPRFEMEHLGFLPGFLSEEDPRPAREQIDANYSHGGGWRPLAGWTREELTITYDGDPPMVPFAMAFLRDEKLFFYPYSQVMIIQKDGSFEVARID